MASDKFVDVVDSLSGATISVPEDQVKVFEAAGFRRPTVRKPAAKKPAGGKSDEPTAAGRED